MKAVVTSNIGKVSDRYKRMSRNLPGVIDRAVHDLVQEEALPLFGKTVATWRNQPRFMTRKTARGYGVEVNPEFPWEWINRGTPKHPIEARNKPMLVWNYPFSAKTKPNMISSFAGSRGNFIASKKLVYNSIRARNFTDIILKRVQARAANRIRRALSDASYGAGIGL